MINFDNLWALFAFYGLNALYAIVLLGLGWWLARFIERWLLRLAGRTRHVDPTIADFLASLMRYLVLAVVVIAVLQIFGIQTTSLVAVLGAASLAIGLALQGTLSNLAAGVMLLIFRPFRIGHSVQIGGIQGTVKELSLFWTELVTPDNVQIIVPNGSVWGQPLRNFSFYPVRGIELHFPVADTIDLERALSSVRGLFESDARIVGSPAPAATLELSATDNSLQLVVKVWTSSGNVVGVRTDVIRGVRETLASPAILEHSRAD